MTDLFAEFDWAVRAMSEDKLDRLASLGVPDFGFLRAVPGARVGVLPVEVHDGFWSPADVGGPEMLIIADGYLYWPNGRDRAPGWECIDESIAIDPVHPTAGWYVRRGDQPALGWQQLEEAQFWHLPVRLHPDPWRWLLSGGQGCVALDWDADLQSLFDGVERVQATTPTLAAYFDQRITEQRAPRVRAEFIGVDNGQRQAITAGTSAPTC